MAADAGASGTVTEDLARVFRGRARPGVPGAGPHRWRLDEAGPPGVEAEAAAVRRRPARVAVECVLVAVLTVAAMLVVALAMTAAVR